MNEKDRAASAVSEEPHSEEGDESIDSLMRAVARVGTVEMLPHRSTLPSPEPVDGEDSPSTPPPLPKVGEVLGARYELTELLGAGGMGAVFAAKHKGTGREVAIKVLLPHQGSRRNRHERISRFVREARAAGRIRHPNVVDIYDVDGDSDTPYIVMERLHGESMWQRIKRGAMPVDEAVRVLIAAMHGVAEVHRQGVVHRDLKPDNIFLAHGLNGGAAVPKVLDFGVSRIVVREGIEPRPTTLTRAGYILGTPSYMPLEQLRGEPDVDARADVYALGVILYEALCGARPYEARNDHELVIRMATEAPTPLAQKVPGIDRSLAAIVTKALARDAGQRFQNVESFASALERWQAGERTPEALPAVTLPAMLAASVETDALQLTPRPVWPKALGLAAAVLAAAWLVVTSFQPVTKLPAQDLGAARQDMTPVREPVRAAPPVATPPTVVAPVGVNPVAASPEPALEASTKEAKPQPAAPAKARGVTRGSARVPPTEAPAPDRATKLNPEDF